MKIVRDDGREEKLVEIRAEIAFYESKRKGLYGRLSALETEMDDVDERLRKLWAEYRKLYSLLMGNKKHNQ